VVIEAAANDHIVDLLEIDRFGEPLSSHPFEPLVFYSPAALGIGGIDDFLDEKLSIGVHEVHKFLTNVFLVNPVGKHGPFPIQDKDIHLVLNKSSIWIREFGERNPFAGVPVEVLRLFSTILITLLLVLIWTSC
jgi:hypothetical protein